MDPILSVKLKLNKFSILAHQHTKFAEFHFETFPISWRTVGWVFPRHVWDELGCVVRIVAGSILLNVEFESNDHLEDALPFMSDILWHMVSVILPPMSRVISEQSFPVRPGQLGGQRGIWKPKMENGYHPTYVWGGIWCLATLWPRAATVREPFGLIWNWIQ